MTTRLLKKALAASAGIAFAAAMASPASAAVYSYTLSGGSGFTTYGVGTAPNQPNTDAVLTIDTTAGTGSVIGSAINAMFTGNFSTFTGGASPTGMFNIAITPTSTLTYQGNNYNVSTAHQPMLDLLGSSINLWAQWVSPTCPACAPLGDTLKNISSTSGGTSVPEPGMLGLVGLGAVAMILRRRKGQVTTRARLAI